MSTAAPLPETQARELTCARQFLRSLPLLQQAEVPTDDACPICLQPFTAIVAEQNEYEVKAPSEESEKDIPVDSGSDELVGVVKLDGCGHIFCLRDLAEWMENVHGSCPTCRNVFFSFTPISESDYESSDGGEYVPDEDDFEDEFEDDFFSEDGDGFPSSDRDLDIDWDDDLGLDGENPNIGPSNNAAEGSGPQTNIVLAYSGARSGHDSSSTAGSGLSDGFDSMSSEGTSFTSSAGEDGDDYAADVSMVSCEDDMLDEGDGRIIPHLEREGSKAPDSITDNVAGATL